MRVALSWLREFVAVPVTEMAVMRSPRGSLRAGFEVDSIEVEGAVTGPLVVGEVVSFDEEPQKNGKTIRWCQVRVADR